jgi:hypothetical protein
MKYKKDHQQMKKIKAWHFINNDFRTSEGNLLIERDKIYTATGDLKLCDNGLHGSKDPLDALGYAPGTIICRTEHWGEVIEGYDKICSRYRKALWLADASEVVKKFSKKCALDVIHLWDAPEVVVKYLKTGDERLRNAARAAARNAARATRATRAAWAAWNAAWDTRAAWAAWAARNAARATRATRAARDARDARDAWDAAWKKQSNRLKRMLLELKN